AARPSTSASTAQAADTAFELIAARPSLGASSSGSRPYAWRRPQERVRAGDGTPPAEGSRGRGGGAAAHRRAEGGNRRGSTDLPGKARRARDPPSRRARPSPEPRGSREARERAGPRPGSPAERPRAQDHRDQAAVDEG